LHRGNRFILQLSELARLRQLQTMQTKHQQLPNSEQQFLLTQVLASTSLTMLSVPFGLRLKAGIKPK
jgi:hypothetical protein